MNYIKYIKTSVLVLIAAFAAAAMSSCEQSLEASGVDEGRYEMAGEIYGYLRDVATERTSRTVGMHNGEKLSLELYLGLTTAVDKGIDVTLEIDPEYVAAYNKKYGTNYEIYPALDLVSLEEQGAILIAPGDRRSDPMVVTIEKDNTVVEGKTYILPIVAQMETEGIRLSGDAERYVFLLRNVGDQPDTSKGTVKTVSVFEVNDTNPLNALEFKMKSSGKYFYDIVVIFAANTRYDTKTGRVRVYNNKQVQHLLDNRVDYIKPLQDAGMKVLLGLVGDQGGPGTSQFADDTARDFARELKAVCDAYELDGILFDDEHWESSNGRPGLVGNSSRAGARMCYEAKMAMPDKQIGVFAYGSIMGFSNEFNGMKPGDYVDFVVPNYPDRTVSLSSFPGISKQQCGFGSAELRRGDNYTSPEQLVEYRNDGYGYQMTFALHHSKYTSALITLKSIAKSLYDDELLDPEKVYESVYSLDARPYRP